MSKQTTAECQFAVNMFKATELAMKNQLEEIHSAKKDFSILVSADWTNQSTRKGTQGDVAERHEASASSKYSNINSQQTNQFDQPS